ncbi:unnamed protein product [Callosobruchus maculatus]|uniref:Uncharacterized protein n=1 Tax=Callosobruchus maculatus TaxID=64391 RepID=A0A653C0E2_CALMS|nr:unnamed protein product [Callosobruchus maculatus]
MRVRVDKCRFDPRNTSLETRLLFNDLTISGRVNLFNELELQREPLDPFPHGAHPTRARPIQRSHRLAFCGARLHLRLCVRLRTEVASTQAAVA